MNVHVYFMEEWIMRRIRRCCLFTIGIVVSFVLFSTSFAQKKKLTYSQAFQQGEPKLLGDLPRIEEWLDEDHYLELQSSHGGEEAKTQLLKVNAITGKKSVFLDYTALEKKMPKGFSLQSSADRTKDYTGFLFEDKGDLYYFSAPRKMFKQLTATFSPEKNPQFSPDGCWLAYTRDHNLYVMEIETGLEHQLTHDGSDTIYNGWASWVYYEEILGRSSRYRAFWWSPDSKRIAFLRFDDGPVPTFPIYRADGVHGELEIEHYPKAGDPNPKVRLGVVHVETGDLVWMNTEEREDQYVAWPFWTPDSKQLFFQWMNRGQDHIILYAADPETGEKKEVYSEKQPSWVEFFEDIYFLQDGSGFLLRSDVDGWSHLYYYDTSGHLKRRLTQGEWSVRTIVLLDEKNRAVYFEGFQKNSTENHLYRVPLDGGGCQQLTQEQGTHHCRVAPGGKYFIDTYSSIQQPQKMELVSSEGKPIRILGDQKRPILDDYRLGHVELFTIPSGDGYNLPAVWILPSDLDTTRTYPVIFSIYSGPGFATVSNSFARLNDHFLAQHGIIVLSVDHRGSGHFGKKGMAQMHRHLGQWEMHDLIASVTWLRSLSFIDSTRVGITGGSYGGYTTCMALTCGADYFTHGIANYSVTDWKLYDTVYTERYMDTPSENPEGYTFGSVMAHADKYKGVLLITHGTMDDNVHMQNTIQFVDKLIDLKKDFQLMLYPNERHGFRSVKREHAMRENVQFWFHHFLGQELMVEE